MKRLLNFKTNVVLSISILCSLLLTSGCATEKVVTVEIPKTEYVFYVPKKTVVPSAPSFEKLNPDVGLDEKTNFVKVQRNIVKLKNYSNQLKEVIEYYEKQIDDIQEMKDKNQ